MGQVVLNDVMPQTERREQTDFRERAMGAADIAPVSEIHNFNCFHITKPSRYFMQHSIDTSQ